MEVPYLTNFTHFSEIWLLMINWLLKTNFHNVLLLLFRRFDFWFLFNFFQINFYVLEKEDLNPIFNFKD